MRKMKRIMSTVLVAMLIATSILPATGVLAAYEEVPDRLSPEIESEENQETEIPEITEAPETPEITATPEITETPAVTEEPAVTEVPEVTDVPMQEEVGVTAMDLRDAGKVVYLSGTGMESGDGTKGNPVSTFAAAKALLLNAEGTIIISGEVKVTGTEAWDGNDKKITVIRDETYTGHMIYAEGAAAALTIKDLAISGNKIAAKGSIARVMAGATLTLENAEVKDNDNKGLAANATDNNGHGGGIFLSESQLVINNSRITGNTSDGFGGGICAGGNSKITGGVGSHISDNHAPIGGGMVVDSGVVATLDGITIAHNKASGDYTSSLGGGIYSAGQLTLSNAAITANWTDNQGGGIYALDRSAVGGGASDVVLNSTVVSGNKAEVDGGGLYILEGSANIKDTSSIENNTAAKRGGGLAFGNGATIVFGDGTTVKENHAEYGGGVYGSGKVTFSDSKVADNNASKDGGGIYLVKTIGGKVRGEIETIKSLDIQGNQADRNGGGLYLGYGVDNSMQFTSEINMKGNRAQNGGGMYAGADVFYKIDQNTKERLIGTMNFIGNSATLDGGGIYKVGNMQLGTGDVRANSAGRNGGGIYMSSETGRLVINGDTNKTCVSDSTIPTSAVVGGNSAGSNGGGIYIPQLANLTTTGVGFIRNTASVGYTCKDPQENHPEEWAIFENNIDVGNLKDATEAQLAASGVPSYTETIGSWSYNNYDVNFTNCDEDEKALKILVQWMREDADGSTSVAFAYTTALGTAGATELLANDQMYSNIWNAMEDKRSDENPHTALDAAGYRLVKAEPESSTGKYTYGDTAVVRYRYLSKDKSAPPTIKTVNTNMSSIKGTGVAGATVTVTVAGKKLDEVTVQQDGTWECLVPAESLPLTVGAVVSATQKEENCTMSNASYEQVRAVSKLPGEVKVTHIRFYDVGGAAEAEQGDPDANAKDTFTDASKGFEIRYDLVADGGFKQDESYYIVLPKGIVTKSKVTIPVENADGVVLFTVKIDKGSDQAKLEFTAEGALGGWDAHFYFTSQFDTSQLEDGTNNIEFELNGGQGSGSIEVVVDEHEPDLAKRGELVAYQEGTADEPAGYVVDWTITVNSENVLLEAMEITEKLPDGLAYVSCVITDEEGEDCSEEWNFQGLQNDTLQWNTSYTQPSDKAYIFTLKTVVTDFSKFARSDKGVYTVHNDVVLGYTLPGGTITNIEAGADVLYNGKFISKIGGFQTGKDEMLKWDLTINPSDETLKNVVITDNMIGDGMEFGFYYDALENNEGVTKWIAPSHLEASITTVEEAREKLKKLTISNANGNQMRTETGDILREGRDFFLEHNASEPLKLVIKFPEINEKRLIRLFSFYNGTEGDGINNPIKAENKATISWDNSSDWGLGTGDLGTGTGTLEMLYNLIEKRQSAYNAQTQEISWGAAINRDMTKLTNVKVYEMLGEGQEWIGSETDKWGIKIYCTRESNADEPLKYTYSNEYDKFTVNQTTITAEQQEKWGYKGNTGLEITFKEPLDMALYIVVTTKVTDKDVLASLKTENFQNTVALTTDEVKGKKVDRKNQEVEGRIVEKVSTEFDPQKNIASWVAIVNTDFVQLGETNKEWFTITDVIADDYIYVEKSLQVKRWKKGESSQSAGEDVTNDVNTVVSWKKQTLTVTIKNPGDYEYRMYFDTQVVNLEIFNTEADIVQIENELTFTSSETKEASKASASFPVKKRALKKVGGYLSNTDYIDWTVVIDPTSTAVDFSGKKLEDRLQSKLELDTETVYLSKWKWAFDDDGVMLLEEVEDDKNYPLQLVPVVEDQTFSVTLPEDIDATYVYKLTYTTLAEPGGIYTNTIKLDGEGEYESIAPPIDVDEDQHGGSGNANAFMLLLDKRDEQDEVLQDVKFTIEDDKGMIVRSGKTNENGELSISNLRYNSAYTLREIETKAGYQLLEEGITFTVTKENAGTVHTLTIDEEVKARYQVSWNDEKLRLEMKIVNEPKEYDLAVAKYSLDDQEDKRYPLTNTTFRLSQMQGEQTLYYQIAEDEAQTVAWVTDVDEATTLGNGEFTLSGLLAGEYTLTETKVEPGWLDEGLVITIAIAVDGTVTVTNNVDEDRTELGDEPDSTLFIYNKRATGKITLIKKNEAKETLAGAQFDYYYQADGSAFGKTPVNNQPLTTDADGKIEVTDLLPGNYRFVETKAPTGYVRNEQPLDVTVEPSVDGEEIAPLEIEYLNYRGAVQLLKTDEDGKGLADAVFDLYEQSQQEPLQQDLHTDEQGMIKVAELAPGNYYFVETKAPKGYQLDETKVVFTIEEACEGEPELVEVTKVNKLIPEEPEKPEKPEKPEEPEDPKKPENPNKKVKKPTITTPNRPSKQSNAKVVKTGDGSGVVYYVIILAIAAGLMAAVIMRKKKSKQQ